MELSRPASIKRAKKIPPRQYPDSAIVLIDSRLYTKRHWEAEGTSMSSSVPGEISRLMTAWLGREEEAPRQLIPVCELRVVAHRAMHRSLRERRLPLIRLIKSVHHSTEALGISPESALSDCQSARAWLSSEVTGGGYAG